MGVYASQFPVVNGAGASMRVRAICLRDARVTFDHFQVRMSQQGLQGENIAFVPQVSDGKGMAEAMWIYVRHASAFSNPVQEFSKHIARHGPQVAVRANDEKPVILFGAIQPR